MPNILQNQAMLTRWKEIDSLETPEQERILSVVDSLVRDAKARKPTACAPEGGRMMPPQLEQIQEKLGYLAPDRLAEVEDFIDFLQQRDQDKLLRNSYSQASEEVFNKVWDNDDDAIYDNV